MLKKVFRRVFYNEQQQSLLAKDEDKGVSPSSEEDELPTDNFQKNCNKLFYQFLTNGAAYISNIFHGIFFAVAAKNGTDAILRQFNLQNTIPEAVIIFPIVLLSTASTICDATITNPPESTVILANSASEDANFKLIRRLPSSIQYVAYTLKYLNIGVLLYFIIFNAASDILPISYISSDLRIIIPIAIPLVSLSTVFLYILLKHRIVMHTYELVRRLVDTRKYMLMNAIKSPAKSLEVIIQTLSSALNQAVANGNITAQILIYIFAVNDSPAYRYIIYSGIGTGLYTAIFSRILNVHGYVFNKKFEQIKSDNIYPPVSKIALSFDFIMSVLRGFPTGFLLYKHIAHYPLPISIVSGSLLGFHSFYVRYITRRNLAALELLKQEDKIPISSFSSHAPDEDKMISSGKIFDSLITKNMTSGLKKLVAAFNFSGRLCGSLSFLGFLFFLRDSLKIDVDFYTVLCIHQLWGNTTLENDFSFYQNTLVGILAAVKTKYSMETQKPYFGVYKSIFLKSKNDYPIEYLNGFVTPAPSSI